MRSPIVRFVPVTQLFRRLFGRIRFWNDKRDQASVEDAMVRVSQFNEHFVRTGEKTHQDDRVTTRICPDP